MTPWPQIPEDVVTWFRGVFSEADRRVCERLVNQLAPITAPYAPTLVN